MIELTGSGGSPTRALLASQDGCGIRSHGSSEACGVGELSGRRRENLRFGIGDATFD
jgi:hypothetical protein